jgi:PAS domain S-box-containing protein
LSAAAPHILLVEDDDGHALLIARHLAAHDPAPRLTRVDTLRAARERLATEPVDLVISDLRLPDGDGASLLPAEGEEPRLPLIAMTGFGDQRVAVAAMRRGALDYVVKSESAFADLPRLAERALREWALRGAKARAEAALRASEAHFRSLIENGLDLIAVLDAGLVLRYLSPSARPLLGRDPDTLVGRPWQELVHPDDAEASLRTMQAALADAASRHFALVRLRARDGSWPTFDAIVRGRAGDGGGGEVVLNARDVSERLRAEQRQRELEAQLRQTQKLETLGTLAGGIAHDFNNILQAMGGCTELALLRLEADSPARRYLERSLEVARRARDLVRQVVQFSRRAERRREPVGVVALVREVAGLLKAAEPRHAIEARFAAGETGAIVGDASQVHQVLMNLATNALQAMGERGGRLELSVESRSVAGEPTLEPGRYVVVTLSDTGPGVPPEIRQRVFEPFFTTRGVGGGSGLGLSVAHGIVKSHGGEIVCESEPGHGATFRVYLPAAPGAEDAAGPEAAPGAPARARVLFVDDDEVVVYVAAAMLERLGHEAVCVRDGAEALERLASAPGDFDVLVTDELMPRMTGSQVAAEAWRLRPGLPVVIASGHGLPGQARFDDLPGVVYLSKPFETRDLSRAVDTALRRAPWQPTGGGKRPDRPGPEAGGR